MLLAGCASTTPSEDVYDPWEGYNRAMYSINDGFDRAIAKPVAKGYDFIMPAPMSQGVTNFFSNLDDFRVVINDLLQFKFSQAAHDTGRFVLNSTVGVAGIFDVASYGGIEKHREDFGQTLGVWGVGNGPYFVIPILGPSTVRDSVGLIGDAYTSPVFFATDDVATRNALIVLFFIDTRANLLGTTKILEEAAEDKYAYVRNAYMQYRRNLVYDGNPPDDGYVAEDEILFGDE